MRIDLNPSAMPELGRSTEAASGTKTADMTKAAPPDAEDVAHLSSGSDAVHRLKAQLDTLPDVRGERVDALRQAINAGTYKISPQAVAAAMLADSVLKLG